MMRENEKSTKSHFLVREKIHLLLFYTPYSFFIPILHHYRHVPVFAHYSMTV